MFPMPDENQRMPITLKADLSIRIDSRSEDIRRLIEEGLKKSRVE
jgi:hypothetical protein